MKAGDFHTRACKLLASEPIFALHDAGMAVALYASNSQRIHAQAVQARALELLGRDREAAELARRLLDAPELAADRKFLQKMVDAPLAAPESAAEADATPKVAIGRLRLNFGLPLPDLVAGRWHHVRLRLSNELGLFSAEAFGAQAACAVRLWALPCDGAAPPLPLAVRQAAEPTAEPTADAARPTAAVRIVGGRAVCEVRAPVAAAWNGAAAPCAVVLMAEPLAAADDGGAAPLGCLSLPLALTAAVPLPYECDADVPLPPDAPVSADEANTAAAAAAAVQRVSATLRDDDDAGGGAARLRVLPLPGRPPLVLAESAADIHGKVWDSGLALVGWLDELLATATPEAPAVATRCIELGSGVGVGGLAAAALGGGRLAVVLTDLPEATALLRLNARANDGALAPPPRVAPLAWGDAAAARDVLDDAFGAGVAPDLVLCSDVVYDPEAYAPLLTTLCALARAATPPPRVWMGHRSRHPQEHEFWTAAAASFDVEVLRGPVPFTPLGAGDGADAMPRLLELRWRGMRAAAVLSELLE